MSRSTDFSRTATIRNPDEESPMDPGKKPGPALSGGETSQLRSYSRGTGRDHNDVETEAMAHTCSEHCCYSPRMRAIPLIISSHQCLSPVDRSFRTTRSLVS